MGRSPAASRLASRVVFGLALLFTQPAGAQNQGLVVRDGSLGPALDPGDDGIVTPGLDDLGTADYLIRADLGEQHGGNLFHSFLKFSIGSGERATFTDQGAPNPGATDNVISRVTGPEPSQIDGTLHSTIPGADVWLLNPNGVMFGAGAELDVPGSFHASTGDYVGFGEGGLERFYADGRPSSVLSTARPEAFGFLGEVAPGPISVTGATLAVPDGEAIELAGGDVTLTAATLDAPGGAISIRGGRIVVAEGSKVRAESTPELAGGTIDVVASTSLLVDGSLLSVNTSSARDAGTIHIEGGAIILRNGSGFPGQDTPRGYDAGAVAETSGSGAGGTIRIDAESLDVTDGAAVSVMSVGANGVEASGAAGAITIEADALLVATGANFDASSWASSGDGGDITIRAGTLEIDGGSPRGLTTGIFADSIDRNFEEALGNPGAIEIEAQSVELADVGVISAACYNCVGVGGSIEINTGSLELRTGGVLTTQTAYGASGNAGDIRIRADSVLIHEPSVNGTGVFVMSGGGQGQPAPPTGDAGDVFIDTGSLVIEDQGIIRADTVGEGAGGSVVVLADSVQLGTQGIITAGTMGSGGAGTIDITASESILVDGEGDPLFSLLRIARALQLGVHPLITGVFSANGRGTIELSAPEITVSNGALVLATSVGGGDAGSVSFSADRIAILDGGFVDSTSMPEYIGGSRDGGNAGSVTLSATDSIEIAGRKRKRVSGEEVEHWSRVASASLGSGEAGTVTLEAPRILIDGGAVATTALAYEDGSPGGIESLAGGDIVVRAGELLVRGGGRIDASSFTSGPGGSIDVAASESIVVEGAGSGIASRTGAAGVGGSIALRAPVIEVSEQGEVSARSAPHLEEVGAIFQSFLDDERVAAPPEVATGNAGSVTLTADKLHLFGGIIATNSEAADGGNITIEAKKLVHLDAGEITAAVNDGAGGNITIDPEAVILQNGSRIVADAGTGSGGNIRITADNYFAFPGTIVDASSDLGLDGVVEVHTPDVSLAGALTSLPSNYLDAASQMKEPCAARRSGERAGSFAVRAYDGIPPEPDGWLPATMPSDREIAPPFGRVAPSGGALLSSSCR